MCSPQKVVCFVCYKVFPKDKPGANKCCECGDFKCPICKGCLCSLTIGEQRVALAMMRTYEPLLGEKYNFSKHKKIEKRIKKFLAGDGK